MELDSSGTLDGTLRGTMTPKCLQRGPRKCEEGSGGSEEACPSSAGHQGSENHSQGVWGHAGFRRGLEGSPSRKCFSSPLLLKAAFWIYLFSFCVILLFHICYGWEKVEEKCHGLAVGMALRFRNNFKSFQVKNRGSRETPTSEDCSVLLLCPDTDFLKNKILFKNKQNQKPFRRWPWPRGWN